MKMKDFRDTIRLLDRWGWEAADQEKEADSPLERCDAAHLRDEMHRAASILRCCQYPAKYLGDWQKEEPDYSRCDWRHATVNGETMLDYRDWIAVQKETDEHEN